MVDLSRLMKRWSDDRLNWRKGQSRVMATAATYDFVDHMLMNGIWHVQQGGNLTDLKPDYSTGGYGKFDEHGNRVVLRRW